MPSFSVTGFISTSNAPTIDRLGGVSSAVGGSVSIAPVFTVGTETSSFVDENQNLYTSGALSFGFGLAGATIAEIAGLAKAAAGAAAAVKSFAELLSSGSPLLAEGPALALVGEGVEVGTGAKALLAIADGLLNLSDIAKDVDSLKESIEDKKGSTNYSEDGKYTGGRTQEELDDLAKDPAHTRADGTVPDKEFAKGQREAITSLGYDSHVIWWG